VSVLEFVLIALAAFVIMEPVTAATHRWVMHGIGEWFHRSHHRPGRKPRWERNDWFPVFFAAIVLFGLWLGFNRDGFAALVPVAIGVTRCRTCASALPIRRAPAWLRRADRPRPLRHSRRSPCYRRPPTCAAAAA